MVEKISREEIASRGWLAGMVEGDGWLALSPVVTHNGRLQGNRVEVGVGNNDPRIIRRVSQIWAEWKIPFHYALNSAGRYLMIRAIGYSACRKIIERILPHLTGKKEQAVALLAFIEAHDMLPRYFHKDPDQLAKFIRLSEMTKQILSEYKHRDFNLQRLKRAASKVLDDGIV